MMRYVKGQGGDLATECFGKPGDPAVILVMGATASMLGWPDALCTALADQGLFVVRLDHRDTGGSVTRPPGEADYSVEDMADDILTIMDAYRLDEATLMGMSLGGYISQMIAVEHPERVRSLVLYGAEPLGWDGPDLPQISQTILDHFGRLTSLDWADKAAVAAFLLEIDRMCAGTGQRFDEVSARARIDEVLSRTSRPASMFNHVSTPVRNDWTGRFRDIECPVLVLHGADDPVLPADNGRAAAAEIKGAELVILDGVGHEIPGPRILEIAELSGQHIWRFVRQAQPGNPSI